MFQATWIQEPREDDHIRYYYGQYPKKGQKVNIADNNLVQAIRKGTGARALRSLLERLMLDVMYDVPGSDDILHIHITQPVVAGQSKPLIRRRPGRAAA